MKIALIRLILLLLVATQLHAGSAKLNFEDNPDRTNIRNNYLGNYGVQFSESHICRPSHGVGSGSQALCDGYLGTEFSQGPMIINFTTPQSRVKLSAGTEQTSGTYTVTMKAFDSSGKELQSKQGAITSTGNPTILEIKLSTAAIRSVQVLYDNVGFEMIDDLEFDNAVPTVDKNPPVVKITNPVNDATVQGTFSDLEGTIVENEGIVRVVVKIEPATGSATSFDYSEYNESVKPITFGGPKVGELSPGTNQITVTATDIGGNSGSDTVTVNSVVPVNALRKLGVYSLGQYEDDWKANVSVGSDLDPYYGFWNFMADGMGSYSIDKTHSKRFHDSEVTASTVIPNLGPWSWESFDLVFFYGHNNMITKPQNLNSHSFECEMWTGSTWVTNNCDLGVTGWGTVGMPFDYYADRPIVKASQYPAALTYLYNKHTASLLGEPYDFGGGERSYKIRFEDPVQKISYGKLGSQNLKWLILHGCQAVINSDKDGNYLDLAHRALTPIHGGYHIVLGHRESYSVDYLVPPEKFGLALLLGRPVQEAYFEIDPMQNSSAIAAENVPFDWGTSTMERDNWAQPVSVPSKVYLFSERWLRNGGVGQHPQ